MTIQTKETRDYRGACWTAVEDCNLPGVMLMIAFLNTLPLQEPGLSELVGRGGCRPQVPVR